MPPLPYRSANLDGFEILIGKGARENDELSTNVARPHDLWLHVAEYAGSHIVVRCENVDDVPRAVLERAAALAAFHSKAKNARGKITVHYCKAGDVRKRKGSPAGQVELRSFQTIKVYPRDLA